MRYPTNAEVDGCQGIHPKIQFPEGFEGEWMCTACYFNIISITTVFYSSMWLVLSHKMMTNFIHLFLAVANKHE